MTAVVADEHGRQWTWDIADDRFPDVAAMLRHNQADLCAFAAFPQAHWRKI